MTDKTKMPEDLEGKLGNYGAIKSFRKGYWTLDEKERIDAKRSYARVDSAGKPIHPLVGQSDEAVDSILGMEADSLQRSINASVAEEGYKDYMAGITSGFEQEDEVQYNIELIKEGFGSKNDNAKAVSQLLSAIESARRHLSKGEQKKAIEALDRNYPADAKVAVLYETLVASGSAAYLEYLALDLMGIEYQKLAKAAGDKELTAALEGEVLESKNYAGGLAAGLHARSAREARLEARNRES